MQVKVLVHETKVESLRRGMRARVKIQGDEYQGTVVTIANQPEPSSFFSSNVFRNRTALSRVMPGPPTARFSLPAWEA